MIQSSNDLIWCNAIQHYMAISQFIFDVNFGNCLEVTIVTLHHLSLAVTNEQLLCHVLQTCNQDAIIVCLCLVKFLEWQVSACSSLRNSKSLQQGKQRKMTGAFPETEVKRKDCIRSLIGILKSVKKVNFDQAAKC